MRILLILLLTSPLTYAQTDLTRLVDIYSTGHSVIYTNTSDIPLRCQISSKTDPDLPFGTLAEKKNITLRGYLSYTHHRNARSQIIFCVPLIEEKEHARLDD